MSSVNKAAEKALVTIGAIILTGGIATPIAAGLIARSAAKGFTEVLADEHNSSRQPQSSNPNVQSLAQA